MEQTLHDLEKTTKQAELLKERQPKAEDRNKELKELVAKLEEVIKENKVVEVSLVSPNIKITESAAMLDRLCTSSQDPTSKNKIDLQASV